MDLYIGNATRQVVEFFYRLPEVKAPRNQTIPIGGQIKIAGDLSTPDVEAIIKQGEKYGMCDAAEIDRTKVFTGLCYSIGKSIKPEKLMRLMTHNTGQLVLRGKKMREEASIAENNRLDAHVRETGVGRLRQLDVSVEEYNHDGRNDVSFGFEGFRIKSPDNPGDNSRARR